LRAQAAQFNHEAVLLPLRAFAARDSSMRSLVAELQHARTLYIANFAPGDIIQLGTTRWMVFPWYTKQLDGAASDNSGPLGWAIRYDEP
jgi:hypothetical protein